MIRMEICLFTECMNISALQDKINKKIWKQTCLKKITLLANVANDLSRNQISLSIIYVYMG